MNVLAVAARYPDQQACIAHLERIRWGKRPACPYCGSLHVARKREGELVGRWNCHDCKDSFNVLAGTVMRKTKIPLVKWFVAIALIVNAKKSLSSCQLARDLEMNQGSAWYLMQRVRAAMAADQGDFLRGVIEADETFLGGRPRKPNSRGRGFTPRTHPRLGPLFAEPRGPNVQPDPKRPAKAKRGRGTSKIPVLGAVERNGRVRAMVASDLTAKGVLQFIRGVVDPNDDAVLVTDEYRPYRAVRPYMTHIVVNHSDHYSDRLGGHTNTIEGFWSLLKRALYGQHHHYQRLYSPLYVAEAAWKYNHRRDADSWGSLVRCVFA